jgi:hypothetical protein
VTFEQLKAEPLLARLDEALHATRARDAIAHVEGPSLRSRKASPITARLGIELVAS